MLRLTGFVPMSPVSAPFRHFSPFSSRLAPASLHLKKTKIAQKLSAVGYKAVLPELIFVREKQSTQRIPDVFARVLTRHELNPTCQNRHGFKSRQPNLRASPVKAQSPQCCQKTKTRKKKKKFTKKFFKKIQKNSCFFLRHDI